MANLYLPPDSFSSRSIDANLAADYMELSAMSDKNSMALMTLIPNALDISEDADNDAEKDDFIEDVMSQTTECIRFRSEVLGKAYPFALDQDGTVLNFNWPRGMESDTNTLALSTYLLSLVLSNLSSMSPVIDGTHLYPEEDSINKLRSFFQYASTAALAGELSGRAWSFGSPRPDRSSFFEKLTEIWKLLKDGSLAPAVGVPVSPKDDQVDVIAAKPHADGLPGFLWAFAQVATGANWASKSLRTHIDHVFFSRWFSAGQPITQPLCYHIIPFCLPNDEFIDSCRELGSILHRLRVPSLLLDFSNLTDANDRVDIYEQLSEIENWATDYIRRCQNAS